MQGKSNLCGVIVNDSGLVTRQQKKVSDCDAKRLKAKLAGYPKGRRKLSKVCLRCRFRFLKKGHEYL